MKGVCGCENPTTLKEPLPEVHNRLLKNQETHFIFHSSFFILHHTNSILKDIEY
jgi:hypothetical protein